MTLKVFNWSSKQIRCINAIHRKGRVWLIGGRRSGKSTALVEAARQCAYEWEPGLSGIMAAPTYGQLKRNLLVPWEELVPASRWVEVKDTKNPHILCDCGNGVFSKIYLATGKNYKGIEGATVAWACFTELQDGERFWNTVEARVSDKRAKRLRWFGDGLPVEGWLSEELFARKDENGEPQPSPYLRFPFTTYDNQENLFPGYIEEMKKRWTQREIDIYLNGRFVGHEDASYPNFRRDIHAKDPVPYVPGHLVYLGLDFNKRQQSATFNQYIDGTLRQFDEVMMPGLTQDQVIRVAKRCVERYRIDYTNPERVLLCPDASGKYGNQQNGESNVGIFERAGFHVHPRIADSNPVIDDRDNALSVLMRDANGRSHFAIDPTRCKRTIQSIANLRQKERFDQDAPLTDAVDALGYVAWVVSPLSRPEPPAPRGATARYATQPLTQRTTR